VIKLEGCVAKSEGWMATQRDNFWWICQVAKSEGWAAKTEGWIANLEG
jgi:hypothetical protein